MPSTPSRSPVLDREGLDREGLDREGLDREDAAAASLGPGAVVLDGPRTPGWLDRLADAVGRPVAHHPLAAGPPLLARLLAHAGRPVLVARGERRPGRPVRVAAALRELPGDERVL